MLDRLVERSAGAGVEFIRGIIKPMRLVSSDGNLVTLEVLGYEFGHGPDWHDSNWLVVSGTVGDQHKSWSFRDPCLLTTEALNLADWFIRAADPSGTVDELDFFEPTLSMERLKASVEAIVIRVRLSPEVVPKGFEAFVDIDIAPGILTGEARTWLKALRRFPERT